MPYEIVVEEKHGGTEPSEHLEGDVLAELFGMPRSTFVNEAFGRDCMVAKRGVESLRNLDLPDVRRFAQLISLPSIELDKIELHLPAQRFPAPTLKNGLLDTSRLWQEFHDGKTIFFQDIHKYDLGIKSLCNRLMFSLGHKVRTSAFLTPPGARGFATHYDTLDVIAIQLAGEKNWDVYSRPGVVPRYPHLSPEFVIGDVNVLEARPLCSSTMHRGDAIYLPRGFPHRARAAGGCSLHLAFVLYAIDAEEVISLALELWKKRDFTARGSMSSDLFYAPSAQLNRDPIQSFIKQLSDDRFLQYLTGMLRVRTLNSEGLPPVTPVIADTDGAAVGLRRDGFLEVGQGERGSLIVSNGVKAATFNASEAPVVERLMAGKSATFEELEQLCPTAWRAVIDRLSSMALLRPIA